MTPPVPSTIEFVFQLQEKILARDVILAGLIQIILGERSAKNLTETLAKLDAQIEGR